MYAELSTASHSAELKKQVTEHFISRNNDAPKHEDIEAIISIYQQHIDTAFYRCYQRLGANYQRSMRTRAPPRQTLARRGYAIFRSPSLTSLPSLSDTVSNSPSLDSVDEDERWSSETTPVPQSPVAYFPDSKPRLPDSVWKPVSGAKDSSSADEAIPFGYKPLFTPICHPDRLYSKPDIGTQGGDGWEKVARPNTSDTYYPRHSGGTMFQSVGETLGQDVFGEGHKGSVESSPAS